MWVYEKINGLIPDFNHNSYFKVSNITIYISIYLSMYLLVFLSIFIIVAIIRYLILYDAVHSLGINNNSSTFLQKFDHFLYTKKKLGKKVENVNF